MRRPAWLFALGVLVATLAGQAWPADAQPAGGGGEVTVEDLVARTLAESPDLEAVRIELEAARGRVTQAGLRPNPMLDLGGQKALGPDNNLMVGITLPLDLNGRKEGRVAVAASEVAAKRALVADRERRLRAEVRMKAGEWFAARRNLAFTDELLQANRAALALVEARARAGAAPPLEASLLLVEVNRLDASRRVLEGRAEVVALQLRALVGLPPEAPLALRGDLVPPPMTLDRGLAASRALALRPDLEMARLEIAVARARLQKEEAEGRWDASVSLGYQRQDFGYPLSGLTSTGATRPIQDVFHYIGAGITVTLPVRNRNQGNVAAATAEREAAERRLEFAGLVVRQEVATAFTQYEAATKALELYARGVRAIAQQNLRTVRQSYQLGRIPLLEVIAEQRRLIEIETGYTDALKQVYEAVVEIERAVGGLHA
jgi:cobalt-zinc-cadmium efflux system outer membrane protein